MLVGHVAAGFSGPLPIPEGDIAGQQYPVSPNGTVFECTVPVQNDAYAILVSADRFNASHCGLEIQSHSQYGLGYPIFPTLAGICQSCAINDTLVTPDAFANATALYANSTFTDIPVFWHYKYQ